jgi:hypothetical protein
MSSPFIAFQEWIASIIYHEVNQIPKDLGFESTFRLLGLKAGACSRFTLSRAFYPVFKDGASHGRKGESSPQDGAFRLILLKTCTGSLNLV